MLKKLSLDNITTFQHAEFNFSKGINIIIGENSSGKSHVLKLAYSVATVWEQCSKEGWREQLIKKLHGVFGIEELFELYNRDTLISAKKHSVALEFFVDHKNESQQLSFDINKRNNIKFNGNNPTAPLLNKPIFFPAKEVLSIFPNFISLYEKYSLSFDETYYDLCKAIDNPLLKEPNQELIDKVEAIMGGKIVFKGNHFYLQIESGEMNIFMIAEGWRKLGMLSYLIANDSLKENSILFWDEPETNLNPRLIKQLASFLIELSQHNIQIIIATHNLFLMKYFDYLLKQPNNTIPAAFFSLVKTEKGVSVEQGEQLNQLTTIAALEEELALYDQEQALMYSQW
jgi:energy-coupling factor transporter ATP-binding protein EcfA2